MSPHTGTLSNKVKKSTFLKVKTILPSSSKLTFSPSLLCWKSIQHVTLRNIKNTLFCFPLLIVFGPLKWKKKTHKRTRNPPTEATSCYELTSQHNHLLASLPGNIFPQISNILASPFQTRWCSLLDLLERRVSGSSVLPVSEDDLIWHPRREIFSFQTEHCNTFFFFQQWLS